jgi:hypothetical protein
LGTGEWSAHGRHLEERKAVQYLSELMHFAVGFLSKFQNASTGIQPNANVNSAAIPPNTHIAPTM